ncbi:Inosine-5'-monophosphate dehydrogenase [Pseudoruegeria aquimaris]|uniref:Inosine-5'-monophosphate dehydrogenase n=1 Tax=Pseudoruegeria aquimaris TaxID=393663 RepID=A0A1Y5R8L7_9RHOB|nr:CBS domain-containing protein [Pseudoruegeria aquimaris]SLN11284.1 Inosine-5'-monophosphate dehydrogenase [Pseudoruegeria aquimaris]
MLVQQILTLKGDAGVVTMPPGSSLSEVAALLSSRRIGTVVISSDGQSAEGIVSERDIVRELGKRGVGCMSDSVDDVMTRKLVTCDPSETAESVLEKMTEGRFRHMPVMEEGRMVGLISLGDVVKARLSQLAMEKDALEGMIMGH